MSEICAAALGAIDDHVALVDGRPVTVASLWHDALRSLDCGGPDATKAMVVVHPSWWSSSRVGVVTAASNSAVAKPRSWLLTQASSAAPEATVVVEIDERLVSIAGGPKGEVVAVPRRTGRQPIGEEVNGVVAGIRRGMTSVVLIDAPSTIAGADVVATLIAAAIRDADNGQTVMVVDDGPLRRVAQSARLSEDDPTEPTADAGGVVRSRAGKLARVAAAGSAMAVAVA
ncbi:MAG: type VII secretion-associated protein, partial [Mycobacterium sp.]